MYVLRRGAPDYSPIYGKDAMAAIFSMNLDGSNRQQIFEGSANEVLHNTVASDGENLYLIRIKTETINNVSATKYWLSKFDLSTNEMTDLKEISDYAWMIGAFDKYIVFHSVSTQNSANSSSSPKFGREILVYSMETGELSVGFSWDSSRKTAKMNNNLLMVADANPEIQSLAVYNILTGEKMQEFSLAKALPQKLDGGNFWNVSARDNFFYFTDYLQANMNCINIQTGEISTVGVNYIDPEKNEQRPGVIFAANNDNYLICYDKAMKKITHTGKDGTIVQTEAATECYGIINKETYRNGGTDLTEIKRME